MRNTAPIPEISAELLLHLLHPADDDQWTVRNKGTFYRNYSADVLALDEETHEVELSRDGYLKLLPQGLLALDDDLRGEGFSDKYEGNAQRLRTLQEAFKPFDTLAFRRRLHIEAKVSELLRDKADYLLRTFFGIDRASEPNPYVRTLSVVLPYIHELRANVHLLRSLLQATVGCKVEMTLGRWGDEDDSRWWLPYVRYDLLIENLTASEYRSLRTEVEGLEAFVQEWFMPFDTKCSLKVRHHTQVSALSQQLTLDYNTQLS